MTENSYQPRVSGDPAVLRFGEPEGLGPLVEAQIDGKVGTIPRRWKARAEVVGNVGHYALIHYRWHAPKTFSADKIELFAPRGEGVDLLRFPNSEIVEFGHRSARDLAKLIHLDEEIPGGLPAELKKRMKDMELIRAALFYSMSSSNGYQVVAAQLDMPRQTAALRIAEARKRGFLPPVDTPHSELWDFVKAKYEQVVSAYGAEQ